MPKLYRHAIFSPRCLSPFGPRARAAILAAVCLFTFSGPNAFPQDGPERSLSISPAEIEKQRDWLASLRVHAETLVERPFDAPLSNRSFIVPADRMREAMRNKPNEVAADALRGDLGQLRTVMTKAYGGWASAERHGWNWTAWFEKWDRLLARHAGEKLPLREAFQPFVELEAFQLDNHSGLVGTTPLGSGSASAMLASAPTGACTAMETTEESSLPLLVNDPAQHPKKAVRADLTTPVWYISYPARRGVIRSVRCGERTIAATPVTVEGESQRRLQVAELSKSANDVPSYMPGSVIAGVNTYGVAQFIQPGFFMLPRTGLVCRIALGRSDLYGDDRSFDGYGLDVDVLLPGHGDRSGESILKLAERLQR